MELEDVLGDIRRKFRTPSWVLLLGSGPQPDGMESRIPLAVNSQEVVHSVLAGNADVARHNDSRGTKWTAARMLA